MANETVIIGAGGMLGTAWTTALGPGASCLDLPSFDMTDAKHLARITEGTRVVVNCAAYTDVDGAEANEEIATALNGAAVGRLAARCKEIGATLVHYSTDYVFDGCASAPYRVDHQRAPQSAYGRGKLVGEIALEESGVDFLCVRTSWLYAPHAKNFVRTLAQLTTDKPTLRVVADQRGRPSSALQLVRTTRTLLDMNARGFFHGCDDGECSWHEFATAIGEHVNPACVIEPCTTDEFPRPAPRPAYSVLDLSKTESRTGPIPHWRDSLAQTLDVILDSAAHAPRKAS